MPAGKSSFYCTSCGHEEPRWLGRCAECGEWNTFVERPALRGGSKGRERGRQNPSAVQLSEVDQRFGERIDTSLSEFNRVLGGGLVRGSTVLMGGEPGIGKSTLLLQLAGEVGKGCKSLIISGEESPSQIRQRADRVGVPTDKVHVYSETELERVLSCLDSEKPQLVVIDSIQTLYSSEVGSLPGTVNQMKYCCHELAEWAKIHGSGVVFIAHITKEGIIAGPKVIEHMVDTVLYFDQGGGDLRFLRAAKNRFGSVNEVGIFSMGERGLSQVSDPSAVFLVRRQGPLPPGVVVTPVYEGSRVLMVEIQALVVSAKGGLSRTFSDRLDAGRVSRIAAVLEKHVGVRFSDQDIYVNVAGGIRIGEVGIELPLALALYSARTNLPLLEGTVIVGEVSLAGEVRPVPHTRLRFRTAREMGFTSCVGPDSKEREVEEDAWIRVSTVREAVKTVFTSAPTG